YLFDGLGTSGNIGLPRLFTKLQNGSALSGGTGPLSLPGDAVGPGFGWGVALSADRLAVSDMNDDGGGAGRGAVNLFDSVGSTGQFSQPRLAHKLMDGTSLFSGTLNLATGDQFGSSVAMSGDSLA